jgi:hypothetical protein
MADQSTAFLQQPQFLDPEQQQQLNEIARKQRMAQLLTQTGMTPVQGQMVGNRYVAPSWSQYASQLFSGYSGRKLAEEAESQQAKLAQALKGQQAQEIIKFNELHKTDPNAAYTFAAQSSNPQLQAIGFKKMLPQELTLKPGERHITVGPSGEQKVVAEVPEKPVVVGNNLVDPATGKVIYTAPKDYAGHVVETDNGPVLVDTRTGKATPITVGGQPVAGGKGLTETQSKASVFRSQMVGASNVLSNLEEKGFDFTKKGNQIGVGMAGGAGNILVTPQQQQAKQAQNQWTEAYLRFKTGAGTNAHEVEANRKTFFPQYGDTPDVIKQKAEMRKNAERDIAIAAGPKGTSMGEQTAVKEEKTPSAPIYATNPQTGQRIMSTDGGKTWTGVK